MNGQAIDEKVNRVAASAAILEGHLGGGDWLVGNRATYADFRVACVLPFAELAGLPLADFARIEAWHARLMDIPAWRDPFAGLDAPELRRSGQARGGPGNVGLYSPQRGIKFAVVSL
jgi:glutathione S-transferase